MNSQQNMRDALKAARQNGEQVMNTFTSYTISMHRAGGETIGTLDFNGPEMVFIGEAEESAKVFFDFIAKSFEGRLKQEREAGRAAIAAERTARAEPVGEVKHDVAHGFVNWFDWPKKLPDRTKLYTAPPVAPDKKQAFCGVPEVLTAVELMKVELERLKVIKDIEYSAAYIEECLADIEHYLTTAPKE